MRAFVTGAGGFIGGAVARQLRARRDQVTALVRRAADEQALADIGCELVEGDLVSMPREALTDAIRDSDAVFHAAAEVSVEAESMAATKVRGSVPMVVKSPPA